MSTEYLFPALKAKVGNPQRKLIYITLADIANQNGQCWPSHNFLADRAECSRRSVINHLAELEKAGFIKIQRRAEGGIKASNVYTLCDVQNLHNDVQVIHQGCARASQGGSERDSHKPPTLLKLPVNLTSQGDDEESLFERFWLAYPKKTDKAVAKKAWGKLKPNAGLTDRLIADVQARLNAGEWLTDHRKQFIPGAGPYLNGRKWENEIIPRADYAPQADFSEIARSAPELAV